MHVRAEIHPLFDSHFAPIQSETVLSNLPVTATLTAPDIAMIRWADFATCGDPPDAHFEVEQHCGRQSPFGTAQTWSPQRVTAPAVGSVSVRTFLNEPDYRLATLSWVSDGSEPTASAQDAGASPGVYVTGSSIRFADGTELRRDTWSPTEGEEVNQVTIRAVPAPRGRRWYVLRSATTTYESPTTSERWTSMLSSILLVDPVTHRYDVLEVSPGTMSLYRYADGTVCYAGELTICDFPDGRHLVVPSQLRLNIQSGFSRREI